ncbi:TonB-linked SusC/RagA family outer membrane protein [Algoriphagus iocasae]|uniref:TonB-linked SusC/RagA family outer membrane protein n=1 Tax=Algoriphagus iocasae TaxID=1836499 RepID=A0A841MRI9_9BACT|nr:SusC/RagA family TonB-linked outer membrane protein [Algoriphagus iocasae]MBB6328269.1 TonB-linked SusC/RagA family outer membrane protein [Algoriphagus iocasae]
MTKKLLVLLWFGIWSGMLQAQTSTSFSGKVISMEEGIPLPGALITLNKDEHIVLADEEGDFTIEVMPGDYALKVSYLGMKPYELSISLPYAGELLIKMESDQRNLEEVTVMSTGYQELPAERVTGSFVSLDRKLINRKVSTDLIDRLEDITPGLIFNRGPSVGNNQISIRGRSTLFANTEPLIIVDNFPYDGPLESINPNDVEHISVLKDAAAASIWGARAGNGVIVISTKSGIKSSAPKVSLNSNVNIIQTSDLFYVPQMNMGDFVDIERSLFENNFYRGTELNPNRQALPPVVETLISLRDGEITDEEANNRIQDYKNADLREDIARYYYRPQINQQHSLSVAGGGPASTYQVGLGFDKNLHSIEGNDDDRWTIQAKNSWDLVDKRLTWSVGAYISKAQLNTRTQIPQNSPYSSLVDPSGNPLPIFTNLSQRYVDSIQEQGLLDWYNKPLNEIGMLDYKNERLDGRFQTALNLKIIEGLSADISYQYWTGRTRNRERNPSQSYFVRDLVNRYSQLDENGGILQIIPTGDIIDFSDTYSFSHTLRGMLKYQKNWDNKHRLNVLAGTEVRDLKSESNSVRYYGYNDNLATSAILDYLNRYPYFYNPSSMQPIDAGTSHSGLTDRFLSFYSNMGYTYRDKLDLTLSIRKDQSNFFGVNSNKRGVPLWSAGLGWTLSQENFMSFLGNAYLKWKASYGYSGNLDKSLSGLMTASYFNQPSSRFVPNIPGAQIVNPPNPNLSWEKVGIWNTGFDFESGNGQYTASLEFYKKRGTDLIGEYEVDPASGFFTIMGNNAETRTDGIDLVLGANWLKGSVGWRTDFYYSRVKDQVVKVDVSQTAGGLLNSFYQSTPIPVVDNPLFGVYSYEWDGLNPDTGDPVGILNGEASEDYLAIINSATPENLKFHGSARPTDFGALRNTFTWKGLSLSLNISYRFGYYYRRRSIDYFSLLRGQIGHGDYEKRWQQPGDEERTQIPSLPENSNVLRNLYYSNSAILVERGDHIRLQDIRLGYNFDKSTNPWLPFESAEIYAYANNLGIIWKASKDDLDPDFQNAAPQRSIAFGLRINF